MSDPSPRFTSTLFTWRSAICDSDLEPTTRHVALTLSLHMSERGDSCFPSVAVQSRETGLSDRAIQKHLKILDESGWLSRQFARGKRTEYLATTPERGSGVEFSPPPNVVRVTPERGSVLPPNVVPTEFFNEDVNEDVSNNSVDAVDTPSGDMTGFDEFWTAYPKRNGKKLGKENTRKLWVKLSLDDRRAAWRGAVNIAAAVDADITLPKDPERFLKHRVWVDWQEPATPNARRHRGEPTSGPTKAQAIDQLLHGRRDVPKQPQLHEGRSA